METNAKHTAEPWSLKTGERSSEIFGIMEEAPTTGPGGLGRYNRRRVIATVHGGRNDGGHANATRIVACVNACAGINPETLPKILAMLREIRKVADFPNLLSARDLDIIDVKFAEIVRKVKAAITEAEKGESGR